MSSLAQTPDNAAADTQTSNTTTNTPTSTQASSSSVAPPPYEFRAVRDKSLIAKARSEESQWLDTEYGKILALHRITEAKTTFGTLILLHAADEPQHWPASLENLRSNLPRYGWETLALALPNKPAPIAPARPSSSSVTASSSAAESDTSTVSTSQSASSDASVQNSQSSSSAASSSSASIAREVLIEAYLQAAINYLKANNQFNLVVLVDNSSAPLSLAFLSELFEEKPDTANGNEPWLRALILVNLQTQEPLDRKELEAIFNHRPMPIMDIFFTADSDAQQIARRLHRGVAMRQKLQNYHQLQLKEQPSVTTDDFQSFLLGRIRGFMQRNAKGGEAQKATEASPVNSGNMN